MLQFNLPKLATGNDQPFLSKSEYVYNILKENIVNGCMERDKIYTIVEIAEQLGVSRTPVCEAVKILGSQNYITLNQGVGFRLKELSLDEIRENLIISGALEEAMLKKIIADGKTPPERMVEAVSQSWAAIQNSEPEAYTYASANFHRSLYELSNLPKLIEILLENVFVHEIWYREAASRYPELIENLIQDHQNIITLIEQKDRAHISEVIDQHVENCELVLTKAISG